MPGPLRQRLSFLEVAGCMNLQVIENKAPNLSRFYREAGELVQVSFGESKVKKVQLMQSRAISYATDNLPSRVPNLETLTIYSTCGIVNSPMASGKFLHLKFLSILLMSGSNFDKDYDYLSLVPVFQASPSLETFRLFVWEHSMYHWFKGDPASLRRLPLPTFLHVCRISRLLPYILLVGYGLTLKLANIHIKVWEHSMYHWFEGDPASLRRLPQHCHGKLKSVKIIGFFPQKSMIELACHLLENATSLESLIVDASPANYRCSGKGRKCCPLKSILAVKKYIKGNVPSTVKLNVPKPCQRCHRF
uniref:At1g61320/AtMIF1 LRR domain-containing protein n=1 Tax=Aegilops tauschii TaxID=37682 RepID=M8B581_AEGTA